MADDQPKESRLMKIRREVPARVVSSVPPPRSEELKSDVLWGTDGKPNTDELREHLFHEGRLSVDDVIKIIDKADAIFKKEKNVLTIDAPIASNYYFFHPI